MGPRRPKVLLIEDDDVDREAIHRLLRSRYELIDASLAARGLELYRRVRPDCVLLDYLLPDAEGLEVLNELAADDAAVVLLTGQGSEHIAVQAIRQGAQFYIEKEALSQSFLDRAILVAVTMASLRRDLKAKEMELRQRTEEAERRASQLRYLAHEMTRTEQEVRRKLAESVHNSLQQILAAARMSLRRFKRRSETEDTLLGRAEDLLEQAIAETRALSVELSPPVLRHGEFADALRWLGTWAGDKHDLKVSVEIEDQLEPVTDDLKTFLFEAVRELLFNVVKHAGVGEARVAMSAGIGNRLKIEVSDRGAGFDREKLWRERSMGKGFGLFSVLERIELFGGEMKIESAPGQGMRAELTAPAMKRTRDSEAASAETAQSLADRAIRILVVDDHAIVRQGLVSMLEDEPDFLVVGEANNGISAVRLATQLDPQVVIMDVNMPQMNGVEATQKIIETAPGTQVIGLSVNDDESTAEMMRAAGATHYIRKDGPLEILCQAIREGQDDTLSGRC